MDIGIIDYGNQYGMSAQLRMLIVSPEEGEIYYSFYLMLGDESFDISTTEARSLVNEYYYGDDDEYIQDFFGKGSKPKK
ncbi:hypothetical protein D3C84_958160 [compost metagenome]